MCAFRSRGRHSRNKGRSSNVMHYTLGGKRR